MTRTERNMIQRVFTDLMKHVPLETLEAMSLCRVVKEYQEELHVSALEQLKLRGEAVTEENLETEMSLQNAKDAHEVAKEYAEGKGVVAEFEGMEKVSVIDLHGFKHYEWRKPVV